MLDLVPKSSVKVNDVTVGQVTDIDLDGYHAVVTLELRNDTDLPGQRGREIRQTSLLGEKFVSLAPPEDGGSRRPLGDGDMIPLDRTGRNPEVEEVLGALSLLLNGGGVAQLKTIAHELNLALEGREDSARSVLRQVESLMSPARRQQGRHRQRDRVPQPARDQSVNDQQEQHRRRARGAAQRADSLDQQRADLVKMLEGAQPARRRRRPGDPGVEGRRPSSRSSSSTRC